MSDSHLSVPWIVRVPTMDGDEDQKNAVIVTDESEPWCVAEAVHCLPNDSEGDKTLQYICDLHNAKLKESP